MTDSEFYALVALSKENRGVELKGPGSRGDKAFAANVVRAVLGMANRRDGGVVIIGVTQKGEGLLDLAGLTDEQLATWGQDHFGDLLANYADPLVTFDLAHVAYEGKNFVTITVTEFEDVPILCRRQYAHTLRDGACYVRSRRKPETVEVSSHTDMRDLLDLAVNKGLRRFLARAGSAGVLSPPTPSDEDKYNGELGDMR